MSDTNFLQWQKAFTDRIKNTDAILFGIAHVDDPAEEGYMKGYQGEYCHSLHQDFTCVDAFCYPYNKRWMSRLSAFLSAVGFICCQKEYI